MWTLKDFFEGPSICRTYFGIRPQNIALFAGSIAGAALVATAIYWGVFGFGQWKKEVTVAGRIMTAAAVAPMQGPGQQTGQQMGQQAGQYVCPVHGAVGLPRYNAAGVPVCPVGGEVMQFVRCVTAPGATPVAFAGG